MAAARRKQEGAKHAVEGVRIEEQAQTVVTHSAVPSSRRGAAAEYGGRRTLASA